MCFFKTLLKHKYVKEINSINPLAGNSKKYLLSQLRIKESIKIRKAKYDLA